MENNAQNWVDKKYKATERHAVKKIENKKNSVLFGWKNQINSSLSMKGLICINDFASLTHLNLNFFQIEIESIKSFPVTLEFLELSANSFPKSTLEPFKNLTNIKKLDIGYLGDKHSKLHNQWYGSLRYLKDMKKLSELSIESSDINTGIEYLPTNIKIIKCESDFLEKKCLEIKKILEIIEWDVSKFKQEYYEEEKQIIKISDLNLIHLKKMNQEDNKIQSIILNAQTISKFLSEKAIEYESVKKLNKELKENFSEALEDKKRCEELNSELKETVAYYNFLKSETKSEINSKIKKFLNRWNNNKALKMELKEFISTILINSKRTVLEEREISKNLEDENLFFAKIIEKLKKKTKEQETILKEREWEIKKEKAKLDLCLFINSFGKKIFNLPFINLNGVIETTQGGIFISRRTGFVKVESFGFTIICLLVLVSIYELFKCLVKRMIIIMIKWTKIKSGGS